MLVYITELSKYFILVLIFFYTVEALTTVFRKKKNSKVYVREEI